MTVFKKRTSITHGTTSWLHLLTDINQRLYVHLCFWVVYYSYRVYLYQGIHDNTPLVQLIEMPVKILFAYLNLYILMPVLLKRAWIIPYGLGVFLSVCLGGLLQSEVIRLMIYVQIYDFSMGDIYLPHKFIATCSHILDIIFLTSIIKILKTAYLKEQNVQQIEQEKLSAELKFLRAQIHPHFIFNTLNNLYALILIKSEKAEEVVLKLSALMRYMLYETNQAFVNLQDEIRYLKDYTELERLRFGEELAFEFTVNTDEKPYFIPPFLLIPLIENAFKHAGLKEEEIHISIDLIAQKSKLTLRVQNTLQDKQSSHAPNTGGLGLKNIQRRLALLYPEQYTLKTNQTAQYFQAYLEIPLEKEPVLA